MALSSLQLEAFAAVAREVHFSRAAKSLGITQSALSLRIQNLESEVRTTLFIRGRSGVSLTEAGQKLLKYCRMKESLEADALEALRVPEGKSASISGILRIGGFSSVARSILLPRLRPLLSAHPGIQLRLVVRELDELPKLLRQGEIDFMALDRAIEDELLESRAIGEEENVLIAPKKGDGPGEVFLDHDESDPTTARFFQLQPQKKRPKSYQRAYLDDVYGIIDGVRLGLGSAVVPRHLVEGDPKIRILPDYVPMRNPVVLHHFRQPYYSRLHSAVIEALTVSY